MFAFKSKLYKEKFVQYFVYVFPLWRLNITELKRENKFTSL